MPHEPSKRPLLYVEDDEDEKDLTLFHFREAGFSPEVLWARDGEQALDRLRRASRGEVPLPVTRLKRVFSVPVAGPAENRGME